MQRYMISLLCAFTSKGQLVRNTVVPLTSNSLRQRYSNKICYVASKKPPLIKLKSLIRGVIDVSIHYLLFKQ